jgi:uncharacterized protein (TIGR03083 family)
VVRFDGRVTELVDATIAELRAIHDRLAAEVAGLTPDQLTGPSGAEDWTIADALSHLGSSSEIGWYSLEAAATGERVDAPENQEVWDRWNGMAPADQASSFVQSEEQTVATLEGLSPERRESVTIDLGFMPEPLPLASIVGMRLNEQALHGWDVEVGLDPTAALSEQSAALVAEHLSSTMTYMLGFVGKPAGVGPARIGIGGYTIVIADAVSLEAGDADTTATFHGPLEAAIRLLAGRLKPQHTPDGVTVEGNVTLDELRTVFPGY